MKESGLFFCDIPYLDYRTVGGLLWNKATLIQLLSFVLPMLSWVAFAAVVDKYELLNYSWRVLSSFLHPNTKFNYTEGCSTWNYNNHTTEEERSVIKQAEYYENS